MSNDLSAREAQALSASKHGFWLVASLIGPCDQTIETFTEHARFYHVPAPSALLRALATSDTGRLDPALNAELAALAMPTLGLLAHARPDCPFAHNFATRANAEALCKNLGWTIHAPSAPLDNFLGAIEFCWSDDILTIPSADGDFSAPASSLHHYHGATLSSALLTAESLCQATLDSFEKSLGLGDPALSLVQGATAGMPGYPHATRARWADEDDPMCLDRANAAAILAIQERLALGAAAPSTPSPRAAFPRPRI